MSGAAAGLVSPLVAALLVDGPTPISARVRLLPCVRQEIETARRFVMELDGQAEGANGPRLAYLIGALGGHAQNLLDILDAVTEVP